MEFNTAFSTSKSRLFITTLLPPTPEEVLFHRNTLYLFKFVLSILSLPVKILPGQFNHFLHYEAAHTLLSPYFEWKHDDWSCGSRLSTMRKMPRE